MFEYCEKFGDVAKLFWPFENMYMKLIENHSKYFEIHGPDSWLFWREISNF